MNKLATLIGIALLALAAPLAQGALQISYSIDGAAPVVCDSNPISSGPAVCTALSLAGGTVNAALISGASNSPGTLVNTYVSASILQLTNTDGVAHILTVWIASQDFTAPSIPPFPALEFSSKVSETSTAGSGSVSLTSCVDTTNALAPPTDPFCSAGFSMTNATLNYSGIGALSDTTNSLIFALGTPYSLSQQITITLNPGSAINVTTSTWTPIPEPRSVALFGSVLLATGLGLRRKFSKV